jgi:hypothetical protein
MTTHISATDRSDSHRTPETYLGGGSDDVAGQAFVLCHAVLKRVAAVLSLSSLVVRPQ